MRGSRLLLNRDRHNGWELIPLVHERNVRVICMHPVLVKEGLLVSGLFAEADIERKQMMHEITYER